MKRLFLILYFLSLTTLVFGEQWVCEKNNKLHRREGDGMRLGICGLNNSNIHPDCILATALEYSEASKPYMKLDKSASGSRVVSMTQAEIDALVLAEQQAKAQAELDRLEALDKEVVKNRTITLTRVDNAINNIGNLNDAKVFLKKLVRYIISMPSNE